MSDRIAEMFERTRAEGRPALILFVPASWPEPELSPLISWWSMSTPSSER